MDVSVAVGPHRPSVDVAGFATKSAGCPAGAWHWVAGSFFYHQNSIFLGQVETNANSLNMFELFFGGDLGTFLW